MRTLIRYIWSNPYLLAVVLVLMVIGIIVWYYEQKKEAEASEKLRQTDRKRNDSIWNDR